MIRPNEKIRKYFPTSLRINIYSSGSRISRGLGGADPLSTQIVINFQKKTTRETGKKIPTVLVVPGPQNLPRKQ